MIRVMIGLIQPLFLNNVVFLGMRLLLSTKQTKFVRKQKMQNYILVCDKRFILETCVFSTLSYA